MSRKHPKYALPKDGAVEAALEASEDEYSGDDRSSYSDSSSAGSSSVSSARSFDRYADRDSSARKGRGNDTKSQMKKSRQRRRKRRSGSTDRGARKSDHRGADPPGVSAQSAAVRKAAVTTAADGRAEGKKKDTAHTPHRDTRYDVPTHKKRRKRPHKRKEKQPTSAIEGAASGAAPVAAAPDKYSATNLSYFDEDQIEITLSPSDSYGVEVHESRNVSSRGYAFAKPLDKRYISKHDGSRGGGGDGDGSGDDRKFPPKKGGDDDDKRGGYAVEKPSRASVHIAKFSLNHPALPSKKLSSALTENVGMHRIELQTSATKVWDGEKGTSATSSKGLLSSMPVCDELSSLHKEAHFMQQEIQSIKNDRLVREIDCIKSYDRRIGRKPQAFEDSDDEKYGEEAYASAIFQDEEWDADVLLALYADGGKGKHRGNRKGTWKSRRHADNSSRGDDPEVVSDRKLLSKQQRRKLERKRGVCLTVHISDESIQETFKTEFADSATAIEESDAGGMSTVPSSSDARVRNVIDKYSTMAVSPESIQKKFVGKMTNTTLTSTASKLITVIGCRALRSISLTGISPDHSDSRYDAEQRDAGFWYIFDDCSGSCVGVPPPKFAERLSRERNMLSGGAYPVSNNVSYMASGPMGSYFVRFASGETWWGLGGCCSSHREYFTGIMKSIDVRRIAFGPSCIVRIKGGAPVTVVPWIVLGSDGTAAWSSSLPSSLERLLSDRPRDSAAPVEVSLGAGGSYFVKFADGDFRCVVSSPLANVCRQINAKGARITNMVLHAESYDYIIRHSKFRKT
mmetsp:Transcript_663/g.1871  ORF Transcript_663/g.1871 Transcript_663/m.1871 type:complete len:797 (+) Transcript_663:264-2654(+)